MKYVNVSGGADSTAMALLLWERGENFELLFADTGAELPENYWLLPKIAQRVGKPLRVVSNGGFFKWLVAYNYLLPGVRGRWCTRILKQKPLEEYAPSCDNVHCVGIRADEPRRQESQLHHKHEMPLVTSGLCKEDVKRLCSKYALLNPVYSWRTNVSCFCCPFQRKSDWLGLLKYHPSYFAIAEEWERNADEYRRRGDICKSLSWLRGKSLSALREMDQIQLSLIPECEEEPCLICKYA